MRFTFLNVIFFLSTICFAQDIDILPKNVNDSILNSKRTLRFSDPFNEERIMQKLFPGKLYHLPDKNTFVSWNCKTCKPAPFVDVNGVEGDQMFPYTNGVATRLLANIDYADSKDNKFKIIAFNHSTHDEDGLQTGRFSGGLLGLAKFAKNGKIWEMKSFQPAVAAFGAFAQCPTPKIVEIGEDQFAFTLSHINGGAGGPYEGYLYLVAGLDGKYQIIMEVASYRLTNMASISWSGSYKVVEDSAKKHFRDIIIKSTGTFNKDAKAEDEFEATLPEEIAQMAKTKTKFDFEIERRFSFKGKFYKMVDKPTVKFSNVK
nr:glycoside hydrolase family 68 protein [uncultured Flavobacterium sp.]